MWLKIAWLNSYISTSSPARQGAGDDDDTVVWGGPQEKRMAKRIVAAAAAATRRTSGTSGRVAEASGLRYADAQLANALKWNAGRATRPSWLALPA